MLIKKIICIPFFAFLLNVSVLFSLGADISAASAVVINADTKEIIYEKNAFEKRSMASTTKIMTSIIAIESGKMNHSLTVPSSALTEGSSIGLKAGYMLTLESLVYGMMLESGNDAANVCALYLGGTFADFTALMNLKAREIDMRNTNFVTPSGLDDANHYSTAYDMALLGAYSIKNPAFREICSLKSKEIDFIKPDISVTFSNHNKLLDSCEGVFGVKTGFTKKSGRCLVSACKRDGATLICVTLNAGDDWNDHIKLYDLCFTELNKSSLSFSDFSTVSVYGADMEETEIYCDEYVYHFKEHNQLTKQVIMPKIIYAPIKKNEAIGKVNYYQDNELVYTSYIRSKSDVLRAEETYKEKPMLKQFLKNLFSIGKE